MRKTGLQWWILNHLTTVIHEKENGCPSNFARAKLQGMFYHIAIALKLFILLFGVSAITHQQLVAMLEGHVRSVCTPLVIIEYHMNQTEQNVILILKYET